MPNQIDISTRSLYSNDDIKSIGRSVTLSEDITDIEQAKIILLQLADEVGMTARTHAAPLWGARTGLQFPEDSLALGPGATVALYTDGLTEARDPGGALYGLERLERSLEGCRDDPVRDTLRGVWDDVVAFRGDSPPTDDATLLLVRLI